MKQAKIILIGVIFLLLTAFASAFDLTVGVKEGVGYPFFFGLRLSGGTSRSGND